MLDWSKCAVVERVPGKVSGAWVFRGTRVPVKALFENLEGGATVDQFLEWFPGVSHAAAKSVLKFAAASLAIHEEGLRESAEILANPKAMKAIADYASGKM